MIAPALVKPETMEGTGFLGAHAAEVYRLADDDLYLVGTSEVALAGYHSDEILDPQSLPLRYAGFSSCFRREAGSLRQGHPGHHPGALVRQGRDVLLRRRSTRPRDEHQRLLAWEREFLDKLELAYRVIDVAAGDLGSSAARKFDFEAWFPSQGAYRELTSTSNCTTFQSRRLNIRARGERRHRAGGHAQRHAVRDRPHDRLPARSPPAAGRLGVRAGRAAPVARRSRAAELRRPSSDRDAIKLVATDLDGTLLRTDGTVSDRTRAALDAPPRTPGCSSRSSPAGRRAGWTRSPRRPGTPAWRSAPTARCSTTCDTETVVAEHPLRRRPRCSRSSPPLRASFPNVRSASSTADGFAAEPGYRHDWEINPRLDRAATDCRAAASATSPRSSTRPAVKLLAKDRERRPRRVPGRDRRLLGGRASVTHSSQLRRCSRSPRPASPRRPGWPTLADRHGITRRARSSRSATCPTTSPMLHWAGRSYAVANAHPAARGRAPTR